jgi:hypothetical protein
MLITHWLTLFRCRLQPAFATEGTPSWPVLDSFPRPPVDSGSPRSRSGGRLRPAYARSTLGPNRAVRPVERGA